MNNTEFNKVLQQLRNAKTDAEKKALKTRANQLGLEELTELKAGSQQRVERSRELEQEINEAFGA